MTEQDATATPLWCPRCLRTVDGAANCPWCGLRRQGSAEAARLRVVVHRRHQVGERRRALAEEDASLLAEQRRLLQALAPEPAGAVARSPREWRPEVVRGVLLWLGSVLVALAALIFAVVAWVRLGDLGRAGLLAGATLMASAGAAAGRRRLPATAEALGGLALALGLVDWYAVRRAGVAPGWSPTAWWALGTGAGAAVAAASARWLRAQRLAAAVLAQLSGVLVVATAADAAWTVAAGLALVAAAAATAGGRLAAGGGWRLAALAFGAGAVLLELAALGAVMSSPPIQDLAGAAGPAAALATMALAPALARVTLAARVRPAVLDGLVAVAAGALLAGGGALLAAAWRSWALLAALAVLGAAAVGLGVGLPRALRRGVTLAASATLAVGVVGLLGPLLGALAAPLAWVADPWTARLGAAAADAVGRLTGGDAVLDAAWPVIVMLTCVAGAGVVAAPSRGWRVLAATAAAAGVVAVLPLAAGWPLWAALLLQAAGGLAAGAAVVLADRRGAQVAVRPLAGCAALLLVLAAAWALATEAGTLLFLGMLVPAAAAATTASTTPWLRRGWAAAAAGALLGESAAAASSAGGQAAEAGLAVAVAAALPLLAGVHWRQGRAEGPALEALGLGGLVLGVALAGEEPRWLAGTLTAAVAVLLLAALAPARRWYLWGAAVAAVAATWAWLDVAQVRVPEAYTLPAAAVALAAGAALRRGRTRPSSWLAFGPGLALALLPSLGLAIDRGGVARPLLLTGGALLVVLAGAGARLQAPLVLGAGTLVVLGLDAALPVAAQLPRWVTIGAAGLLLLWLGATAERRLARLRELREQFQALEPR
jgi:hypothetical protein